MPFIMGILAIAIGGYFWMNRARNAAYMANDLADMAQGVMGAVRRPGGSGFAGGPTSSRSSR